MNYSTPRPIIHILIAAGYDNALSIENIDESDIKLIEEHAEQKSKHLIKQLENYNLEDKFEFLPGHRKLLFYLKEKIREFQEIKISKLFESSEELALTPAAATASGEESREEIELFTADERSDLKKTLLTKLNASASATTLHSEFTEEHIVSTIDVYISTSQIRRTNPRKNISSRHSYKCTVKCTNCDRVIPCTFTSHWQIGNLDKHLKTHISNTDSNSISNHTSNDNIQPSISTSEQYKLTINEELDVVLGLITDGTEQTKGRNQVENNSEQ